MGQSQSNENSASTSNTPPPSTNSPRDSDGNENTSSSPMGSLLAEAAAFGEGDNNENESLEAKAQRALDCPCIADLRNGSCGSQFTEAFRCFLMSTAEEKGSDCVHPFVALQKCVKANPNAFSKDVLEDEKETEKKEEQQPVPQQDHRIIPPLWAKDPPRSGKSKL